MKCPNCGAETLKTLQTRDAFDGEGIRRRKECAACNYRFTTFEVRFTKQTVLTPVVPEGWSSKLKQRRADLYGEDL